MQCNGPVETAKTELETVLEVHLKAKSDQIALLLEDISALRLGQEALMKENSELRQHIDTLTAASNTLSSADATTDGEIQVRPLYPPHEVSYICSVP